MTLDERIAAYAETDRLLQNDLQRYCANLVQIQDKSGNIVPFVWRRAQIELHKHIERQLDARGLVRAIVLKARRLGISTYVGARYYHRASLNLGKNAFILTHEDKSTKELFDLVKLIHERMPDDYRPETVAANENELAFAGGMNGGYRVGTAKNVSGLGRGMTLQLFHGSEIGFWPHAHRHAAGIMKTVSLKPGTEMILESTANGVGGLFYDQWILAEKGQSDYIPIFLPWYIDPDNARPLPSDFDPTAEEEQYQRIYKLTDEQLCWAHFENIALGGTPGVFCPLFRQENPATAAEAFQSTGADSLIPAEAILRARRLELVSKSYKHLPRVLGVDVARGGGDQTCIIDRQGRKAGRINERMNTDDLVQVSHRVATLLRDNADIRRAFIDVTGVGAGVYDTLRNNGFDGRVVAVNYGSQANEPGKYVNRRAEMWGRMKEWFLDPGGADIPDDDKWQRHIAAPGFKYDANSRLQLEKKEDIKKRLGLSPDIGDALAQTFAAILPVDEPDNLPKWLTEEVEEDSGSWETL